MNVPPFGNTCILLKRFLDPKERQLSVCSFNLLKVLAKSNLSNVESVKALKFRQTEPEQFVGKIETCMVYGSVHCKDSRLSNAYF